MTYLTLLTPTNIAEEKSKFFKDHSYSPQFTYDWDQNTVQAVLNRHPRFGDVAYALIAQDPHRIATTARQYFDVTYREEDITFAESLVKNPPARISGNAYDVADKLEQMISVLDLKYTVEVVDRHGFQCRPDHTDKVIRISKYLELQYLTATSIALHEIVHIIRAVNGAYNKIAKDPNFLATDEGLACLVQDNFHTQPSGSAYQHALEYLASKIAAEGSFLDVYTYFVQNGFTSETAWARGIRQKFGICDTTKPGSVMKSGMYFYHEQLLRSLKKEQLLSLFSGKISQYNLNKYPDYRGIVDIRLLAQVMGIDVLTTV